MSAGIDSLTEHAQSSNEQAASAQPPTTASVPSTRSGPRKSNRSSGSSSVDFGYAMISTRWQPFTSRRSSSFDHGYGRAIKQIPSSIPTLPRTKVSRRDIGLDAAPTPAVPGGPVGREQSPSRHSTTVRPNHASSETPSVGRSHPFVPREAVTSAGSDGRGVYRGSVKGGTGVNSKRSSQHVPSVRGYMTSRAGSPTRAAPEQLVAMPSSNSRTSKERHGFFRRVFGSKEKTIATNEHRSSDAPSTRDGSHHESRSGRSSSGRVQRQVPGEDPDTHTAQAPPPVLTKKPSSFFRRRKKSVSEQTVTPALPPHLQTPVRLNTMTAMADGPAQGSPVSSLHEAMDSFLSMPDKPRRPSESRTDRRKVHNERNPVPIDTGVYRSYMNTTPSSNTSLIHDQNVVQDHVPSKLGDNAPVRADTLQLPGRSFLHDNSSTEGRTNDPDSEAGAASINTDDGDQSVSVKMENRPPTGSKSRPSTSKSPAPRKVQPLRERDLNTLEHQAQSKTGDDTTPRKLDFSNDSHDETMPKAFMLTTSKTIKGTNATSMLPASSKDAPISPISDYQSATSEVSQVGADDHPEVLPVAEPPRISKALEKENSDSVTAQERQLAKGIFDGDESVVVKSKAAAWLGEASDDRVRLRKVYMECFDFQDLSILAAFRDVCARLVLKGETQQVDRILDAFSCRWCQCNPEHGFKATGESKPVRDPAQANNLIDVVHTICYSILLLNTDLHMADIDSKMTRAQFIRNTMPTVRRVALDAAPEGFDSKRASTLPVSQHNTEPATTLVKSPTFPRETVDAKKSFEAQRPTYQLSQRPSDHSGQSYFANLLSGNAEEEGATDSCGTLVKAPFTGKLSTWESEVEIILKDFYTSIRQERLPLHGNKPNRPSPQQTQSSSSLSACTGNMLRRTPSMLSKAGSENIIYRGRPAEQRLGTGRWTSKSRPRPRLYPSSMVGSSRTSLEEQSSSVWSPAVSSIWSKYSFNKTRTSMSTESLASGFPDAEFQQSIGFANALSQAIIREEAAGGDSVDEPIRAVPLLEDESLELAGAPWAKEGILKHKHHLESLGKKSKNGKWAEAFAVIEKGSMRLFSFSMNAKSLRQKAKYQKSTPGAVVGGGNWMDNAEALGNFSLRQTIASALPPPGFSRTRPHVWALSLPTGAVHLFHAGTPEIVKEFVTTANYWAARLSKEPLVGGVSNVEYGWSDAVINTALTTPSGGAAAPQPVIVPGHHHRPSLQSSIRSSLDQGQSSTKPRLPGDKVPIHEWAPPTQSLMASALLEIDQFSALSSYVAKLEIELEKHNELRAPMTLAFSPRHVNAGKAMGNWQRKSDFLLKEIVKYRTYVEVLEAARVRKGEIEGEKEKKMKKKNKKGREEGEAGELDAWKNSEVHHPQSLA